MKEWPVSWRRSSTSNRWAWRAGARRVPALHDGRRGGAAGRGAGVPRAVGNTRLGIDQQAIERAAECLAAARDVWQAKEPVGERLAVQPTLELLLGTRLPFGIDHVGWVALELCNRQLQMLGPEANPRLAGDLWIVGDDVHLGVVQQRVLV